MATIAEALDIAVQHHRSGRLAEAEGIYRQILAVEPDNADALHLLGLIAHQVGGLEQAVEFIATALARRPDFPEALGNLGTILAALGRNDEAVGAFRKALALRPGDAMMHFGLGNALQGLDGTDAIEDAIENYRSAIRLNPEWAEAHNNLGHALQKLWRWDEALASGHKAVALGPNDAGARNNLGNALKGLARFDEAIACYRAARALKPDFLLALTNLANTLKEIGRFDEARRAYDEAIAQAPDDAEAHNGLGALWALQGRPDVAAEHFERALRSRPDFGEAKVNRALTRFVSGDLKGAWADYEARWDGLERIRQRPFPQPRWDGRPLDGQELLVWSDHGLGDEIMGVGMLPQVMERAPRLVVECDPRMVELLARSFPMASFVPRRTPPDDRALAADRRIALFSLGGLFRAEATDFPRHSGYLTPDPAKAAHWKEWLDGLGPGLKVGLSWKGRPISRERPPHFPSLDRLAVVLGVPGVVFINIQYDDSAADVDAMRRDTGVEVHCPPGLDLTNDLDGVAALVAGMDAVVGPATAVVVLAGALGRPGWMNAYYPVHCELALCNLDHVPWCPSIRAEPCGFGEDWGNSLQRIADGLRRLAASPLVS